MEETYQIVREEELYKAGWGERLFIAKASRTTEQSVYTGKMAKMQRALAYLLVLHVFVEFRMNSVQAGTRHLLFTRDQDEEDVPFVTITGDESEY